MPQVPWTELEPLQVQKLISALLVRLMTGAYAVGGSGGDDGADVVRPVDGGVHVYEIKSFTATLRPGQKSQVRKSLTTAREHRARMLLWTLVIPHDPTPAEERWLAETLAPLAGVPVAWMGRTQLEAAFAEHPHLARAFLPGSSQSRALELLAQHHQEQAGLAAGVPDAVERGGKLRELLAEVDPDFDFDLDLHAGETTIHVVPRDAHTLDHRPIGGMLSLSAEVGSPEAAAIEDFYAYGAPLSLSAANIQAATIEGLPGGLDELFRRAKAQELRIGAARAEGQRGRLVAVRDSKVIDRLAVSMTESTAGAAGGVRVLLTDDAGVVRIEMRVGPDGRFGDVNFAVSATGALPDDALPAAQFIASLGRADSARMEITGKPSAIGLLPDTSAVEATGVHGLIALLEALQRVQDACGASFLVPEQMDAREQALLQFTDLLVRGDHATWPWPGCLIAMPADSVRALLSTGAVPRMGVTGKGTVPGAFVIAGRELTLPGQLQMRAENVVVTNPLHLHRALEHPLPPDAPLQVRLEADGFTTVTFELVESARTDPRLHSTESSSSSRLNE